MKEKLKLKDTTATKKIFSLSKRIRAVCGGTSASKTISIIIWCIDYAQSTKGELVSIASESFPHLSGGAMLDFEMIMKDRKYWKDARWVKTPKPTYTFETGSKIEFIAVDAAGKAHGPRRDVLFLNECNNLSFEIVTQLMLRTRKVVWMDWNPVSEFWYYSELEGKRDDIDFLRLTYLDNEALDNETKREIESHRNNKNFWKVYGLGELGESEGRIFVGWKIVDEIPHEARLERYGLDFGYSNDPSCLVAIYYYNGGYILDEILFQKGMSNKQIADVIINNKKALVIADSAEPKSIDELRAYGINVLPASKGPGSVLHRIQVAQDQQISVTKKSINIIKEYRNYLWETDVDGRILNEPQHIWSHSMDAFMYGLSSLALAIQRNELISNMPRLYRRPKVNPAR